ncbi:MAG: FtsQ-type POTRA domain-containing protein [Nitrospirota bacterium]
MKKNRYRMKKKSSFRNLIRNISLLFLFVSLGLITYLFIHFLPAKPLLPVKNVSFAGNKHLTNEELRGLSGIGESADMLTISSKDVCRRMLESPWIRSVNVRKEFPGVLAINIEEATPFALLDTNGHLFIVDEGGSLLEELKGDSIPFLPVITGDPYKEKEGFAEALRLIKVMNDKGFSSERDHIEIVLRKPHELIVSIDGNIVKMGSGGHEEKLARFIELENFMQKMGLPVDYVDLRFANKAIVKRITNKVVE